MLVYHRCIVSVCTLRDVHQYENFVFTEIKIKKNTTSTQ